MPDPGLQAIMTPREYADYLRWEAQMEKEIIEQADIDADIWRETNLDLNQDE